MATHDGDAAAEDREALYEECRQYEKQLKEVGVRVKADLRDHQSPGKVTL